jgi:DNA-binding NtrC family response regulator
VQVIAATHQDIDRLVREGRFREDLFYRLNVVRIALPPLRERPEDIPLLANRFLADAAPQGGHFLSADAIRDLQGRDWPGNVRELENAIRRAAALAAGSELTPEDFDAEAPAARQDAGHPALWQQLMDGEAPTDIKEFADLHGRLALAEMMRRALCQVRTDREAGRLLGFIPEYDPDDKAFNNYRAWKRRLFQLLENSEGPRP